MYVFLVVRPVDDFSSIPFCPHLPPTPNAKSAVRGGRGLATGTDAGKLTNRPSSVSARTDDCSVSGFCSGYSGYMFFKASFFFLFGNDIENPTAPAES